MSLEKLEDLNKYITVLIVDDDEDLRHSLKLALEQEYDKVWAVEKAEEADKYLTNTNILLADYGLNTSKKNGIELVEEAKELYGDRIEAIVFSGQGTEATREDAINAKAAAYLDKPVRTDHIKLWINELGKRIWLQQIYNSSPDEVMITDKTGTILLAGKNKKAIFGNDIVGEKCYDRLKKLPPFNDICTACPGAKAYHENQTIRTEMDYPTRANMQRHKVHQKIQTIDVVTAPLHDIQDKPRAIISICRDITRQKAADRTVHKMEEASDWEKRRKIFMDGFIKLGFPRARFYLRDQRESRDLFRAIDQRGEYGDSYRLNNYYLGRDKSTQLMIEKGELLIFRVDKTYPDRCYEPDGTINNLYWVGKNNIWDYDDLNKEEWIDIPLIAGGHVIGKVSTDGWIPMEETPDSYDLEVLGRYGAAAGQIIQNARHRRDTEWRENIQKAILEISKDITDISKGEVLLQEAVRLVCETMGTRICSIFIVDDESGELIRKQSFGKDIHGKELKDSKFPVESYVPGKHLTGKMYLKNEAKYINELKDLVEIERQINQETVLLSTIDYSEKLIGEPLYNCIFVPLIVGKNKIGILRAMNKQRTNDFGDRDFDQQDIEMFKLLAGQIAVALHNANLQKEKESIFLEVSHSLFAPLTSMKGFTEMLADKVVKDKNTVDDYHKIIARETEHFSNLVNQILNLSRIEAHTLPISKEETSVEELIDSIIERNRFILENKNIKILKKIDSNIKNINVDKHRMIDAIQSIIENAIKFSDNNKKIKIRTYFNKENFYISIKDEGIGIPEKEIDRIWDKHYRSPSVKKKKIDGSGIGLTVAKDIIKMHDGSIDVESKLDKGSVFTIKLLLNEPNENKGT